MARKATLRSLVRSNFNERFVSLITNPDTSPNVTQIANIIFMSFLIFRVNNTATRKPIREITRLILFGELKKFIAQMPADATPAIAQLLGLVDGIMNKPTGTIPTNSARRTAHLRSPEE